MTDDLIRFWCINCDARLKVKSQKASQSLPCPACKTEVSVPEGSGISIGFCMYCGHRVQLYEPRFSELTDDQASAGELTCEKCEKQSAFYRMPDGKFFLDSMIPPKEERIYDHGFAHGYFSRYLFFDVETTGLPLDMSAPLSDSDNWPRVVQIAWITCDEKGGNRSSKEYLIKPDGFTIPIEATRIHKISTSLAMFNGVALQPVLSEFLELAERSDVIIAHNMDFDASVVGAEFLRHQMQDAGDVFEGKELRCTMKETTDLCKLPGPYGNKWPRLEELHRFLFGKTIENAHNAAADCLACMKCFLHLKQEGLM